MAQGFVCLGAPMHASSRLHPLPPAVAPAWATLLLTWVNNLGAATVLIGSYFITVNQYGFTGHENLLLGLLQGVMYISGALTVGTGMRWLRRHTGLSTRSILAIIHLLIFACSLLPLLLQTSWAIWLMVGLYAPMTGWLWSTLESYLSAGRNGAELRRATGLFNIGWASSQVVAIWLLVPAMKDPAVSLWLLAILGSSHFFCMFLCLSALPREPGHHTATDVASPTAAERQLRQQLLLGFRTALVISYVLYSALNPLLPLRVNALGVAAEWATPLVSIWMMARVVVFVWMQRWHGWHDRRHTLIWSAGSLLFGFTGCLLAPTWPVFCLALLLFGIGLGGIYSAAFYYAMEVGHAAVDAGGKHEAFIGAGYTVGPLAALAARQFTPAEVATHATNNLAVLVVCGSLATVALLWAMHRVWRPTEKEP